MEERIEQSANPVDLAPAETELDKDARLSMLNRVFLEVANAKPGDTYSAETLNHIQHGGSQRLALNEIVELRGPSPEDERLDQLRTAYMRTLFQKIRLLPPAERAEYDMMSDFLQDEYADGVVAKLDGIIKARTPEDALAVGQLPPVVRKASFNDGEEISMEQFAANHLYLLVDTALKEHVKRRQMIDDWRKHSLRARLASNRGTRVAIGAAIGAASIVPEFGFVPKPDEVLTGDMEFGLRVLASWILANNLPEFGRLQFLAIRNELRAKKHYDQLSERRDLCDWAMRIAYGSTRYGGSSKANLVTGRSGTDDKKENVRRLRAWEDNFPHLNNDPGGKPYTARQSLGYAARLLLDRKNQLDQIIDPAKSAAEQEQLFLRLCKEVIVEDVRRMKKGLNVSKLHRIGMGVLSIFPSVLFSGDLSPVSDAVGLGQDTVGAIKPKDVPEYED